MMIDFKYLFEKYNIKCTGIGHFGANQCQEAEMYNQLGIPEVLWVEALQDVFERGKEHIAQYPNQTIIKACLGENDNDTVIFHVSNNEAQSSSYLELGEHLRLHPEVHYVQDIEMKTITVDSLVKSLCPKLEDGQIGYINPHLSVFNFVEKINFINCDLQGSELLMLKGATNFLKHVDYIYTEVNKIPVYQNCALVDEVDAFLSDFERVETGEWVGDGWTDALYIRKTFLI